MHLYYRDDDVQLWNGDARDLRGLPDAWAGLVLTCPPWWDSGDYGHPDQIGLGQSYTAYLAALGQVWRECYRCLRPGRALVAWVADLLWRDEPTPLVADAHNTLRQTGFLYAATYYWYEPRTSAPSPARTGLPLQVRPNVHAEVILIYRKPGPAEPPSPEALEASRIDPREYQESRQAVWTPGPALDHPYKRLIRLWSYAGDVILDPFAGQGVIALCARQLGRKCVSVELNPSLCAHTASLLASHEVPEVLG